MSYIIILKVTKFHQSTRNRFGTAGKKPVGGGHNVPHSLNRAKESNGNPNVNFLEAPMLNSSVANSLKSSENTLLMNGDKFLSKTQSFLTTAATPLISIWQNISEEKNQKTIGELLYCMQQSIISLGSAFNSLSSFCRHRLRDSLSPNLLPNFLN